MSSKICMIAVLIVGLSSASSGFAQTAKASDWVGRVVITTDGELLGRIEDFSLNIEEQRITYVVVSIGSFLIDDNLIAVHPDALGESDDGRYLVVYTDDLDSAVRFGKNNWPVAADVLASAERQAVEADSVAARDTTNGFASDPIATISDGQRTATLTGDVSNIKIETTGGPRPVAAATVQPKRYRSSSGGEPLLADSEFERLDDNGDGYLSRSEIGAMLNPDVRYPDFDLDDNDGIDAFEFQVLKNRG